MSNTETTQFNLGTVRIILKNTEGLAPGSAEEIVGMVTPHFTGEEGRGALVEIEIEYTGHDERADIYATGELGVLTGYVEPDDNGVYSFTLDGLTDPNYVPA